MSAEQRSVRPVAVNRVTSRFAKRSAQTAVTRLAVPVLVAVGAFACAPTATDSAPATPSTTTEATTPAPSPPSSVPATATVEATIEPTDASSAEASMPDDTTIRFEVEGGYLALARSIVIEPDGTAVIEISGRTSTAQLDPDTVARLGHNLDQSGLFAADGRFETEGADLQRYTITYRGVTVMAVDGVVPGDLVGPIAELEQLILDHRS